MPPPLPPAGNGNAVKRNWLSGLLRRPRAIRLSLIGSAEAIRLWTLICDEPPKIIPLALIR